jgi:hypothetical protein
MISFIIEILDEGRGPRDEHHIDKTKENEWAKRTWNLLTLVEIYGKIR